MINTLTSIKNSFATECKDVIYACDRAIAAKDEEIQAHKNVIKTQDNINQMLNEKVVKLEESKNAIWNNPFVLIGLGVIGGFVIAK